MLSFQNGIDLCHDTFPAGVAADSFSVPMMRLTERDLPGLGDGEPELPGRVRNRFRAGSQKRIRFCRRLDDLTKGREDGT